MRAVSGTAASTGMEGRYASTTGRSKGKTAKSYIKNKILQGGWRGFARQSHQSATADTPASVRGGLQSGRPACQRESDFSLLKGVFCLSRWGVWACMRRASTPPCAIGKRWLCNARVDGFQEKRPRNGRNRRPCGLCLRPQTMLACRATVLPGRRLPGCDAGLTR